MIKFLSACLTDERGGGDNQWQLNQAKTVLGLAVSDEKVLIKEIFEKFLADPQSVDLSQFARIDSDISDDFYHWQSDTRHIDSLSAFRFILSDPCGNAEVSLYGLDYISDDVAELMCNMKDHTFPLLQNCVMSCEAKAKLTDKFGDIGYEFSEDWFAADMPKEVAHYWATTEDGDLSGYRKLSVEAAEILSSAEKEHLNLHEVAFLTKEEARQLANFKGGLILGLVVLHEETAEELAQFSGSYLVLSGLTNISDLAARALSCCSAVLELPALRKMPDGSDYVALAKKMSESDELDIELTSLGNAVAKALSEQSCGYIAFNKLEALSDHAAESLSNHAAAEDGCLMFNSLRELSDQAARKLVKYPGRLLIDDLDNLPQSAAAILHKHPRQD